MLLEGIFLPVTTPFHADGRLFVRKLEANIERYSRTPAAGLFVLSETGEPASLTDQETRMVLSSAIEAAADKKVMVACISRESVFATLELAFFAAEAGYDVVAVHAPTLTVNPRSQAEFLTFFHAIADNSPLPLLLVSRPGRELPQAAIADLALHPNILGVLLEQGTAEEVASLKQDTAAVTREVTVTTVFEAATTRMMRTAAVPASTSNLGGVAVLEASPRLKTRTRRVGFQILSGSSSQMLAHWQAGASAGVPSIAACAPQAACEVWQAFKDGDLPLAEEKQERVRPVARLVAGLRGVAAIKHGCDFNGYFGGRPRLPLLPPTASDRASIEGVLAGMRN